MKFHHGAALALIGWYLIVPPSGRDYPMGNVDAPLSQWSKRPTVYRDQAECEHVLDQQRRLVHAKNRKRAHQFYQQAQCVPADDPRLKRETGGTVPKLGNP